MTRPNARPVLTLTATVLLATGALAGCSGSEAETDHPAWDNAQVNAVSRATMGAGVAATTSMKPDARWRPWSSTWPAAGSCGPSRRR